MDWRSDYSLGIAEIDQQHRALLRSFSSIEEAISLGQGWSNVHYAIVELRELALRHFDFEEAVMRLFGYSEVRAHADTHRFFFQRLEEIEHNSLRDTNEAEMIAFLHDWLKKHILGDDRRYARFILDGAAVVRS